MQFKEYKVFLKALTLILSLLVSGCSTELAYVPNPPLAQRPLLPMKVAVLSFEDKTEDFTFQGNIFRGTYNPAKEGRYGVPQLYPPLLAKFFADDLKNSRVFESVRYVFDPSELFEEDMVIEGEVEQARAYISVDGSQLSLIIRMKGVKRVNQEVFWENVFGGDYTSTGAMGSPAFTKVLRETFDEARRDLFQKLGLVSAPPGSAQEAPSSGKSIEEIFKELKEK